jgi:hypothetical protein
VSEELGKDLEGRSSGPFEDSDLAFVWRNRETVVTVDCLGGAKFGYGTLRIRKSAEHTFLLWFSHFSRYNYFTYQKVSDSGWLVCSRDSSLSGLCLIYTTFQEFAVLSIQVIGCFVISVAALQ